MEKTTHTIITPVQKHEVVFFDWITGREKIKVSEETDEKKRYTLMINSLIVSVGGKTENIESLLGDMHGKDWDFVIKEMENVARDSALSPEKKTE